MFYMVYICESVLHLPWK